MSKHRRAGSQLRVIPSVVRNEDPDEKTRVDPRPVAARRAARGEPQAIPSVIAGSSAPARAPKGSSPARNVIPFTKPRAIAAIAAANPEAVAIGGQPIAPVVEAVGNNAAKKPGRREAPSEGVTVVSPAPPQVRDARADAVRSEPARKRLERTPLPKKPASMQTPASMQAQVAALWQPNIPKGPTAAVMPATAPAPAAAATKLPSAAATQAPSASLVPATAGAAMPVGVAALPVGVAAVPAATAVAALPVAAAMPAATATIPAAPGPARVEASAVLPVAPGEAAAAAAAPMVAEPSGGKWAEYVKMGLGAPKAIAQGKGAKLVVAAYRLLGFAILSIIVVVLVGYIIQTSFFYFSRSWVVPMAVSPTDEKVVVAQAALAEQQNARDRLADELNQAERSIAAQQMFQAAFAKAIKTDLEGRKAALGRVRGLASAAASTRAAIRNQNTAFAQQSRKKMADEYAAGLIDRSSMMSGNYQLAQISSSNLSLAERQAEFETRAADLEATTRSLDAILNDAASGDDTALNYEVLRIKQEYEASRLDLAKAVEARDTLKVAIERQDKMIESLKSAAHLRAVNDGAHIAFVPYANLSNAQPGETLYACKVGMVFCYAVGEVLEVLPGEVQFKHPHRDKTMRGQLIELKLEEEDADANSADVLFLGGKPLFL